MEPGFPPNSGRWTGHPQHSYACLFGLCCCLRFFDTPFTPSQSEGCTSTLQGRGSFILEIWATMETPTSGPQLLLNKNLGTPLGSWPGSPPSWKNPQILYTSRACLLDAFKGESGTWLKAPQLPPWVSDWKTR